MAIQAQEFLFQRIREYLPPHISLVEMVAEELNVSQDSAYRRIRGETPLVLDEARLLCKRFGISLDHLLDIRDGSTLFQSIRLNPRNYSYAAYLTDLIQQVENVGNFIHKEVIYLTKDVPLFHNFYFRTLTAFRYFFWMKTILQKEEFADRRFEVDLLPPEIESLSKKLSAAYCRIPSVEIWNTECINAAIVQIDFYRECGFFSSAADIVAVYESLEETILHLRAQVEAGCKFMPGESPVHRPDNFQFFYNRVILGDNTILVVTDHVRTCYLNYDVLNYLVTRDESFCNETYEELQTLMKRSTLISQTGERQRNMFFRILLHRINERKRNL